MTELKEAMIPEYYIVNRYGSTQKIEFEGDFATWFVGFVLKHKDDTMFSDLNVYPVFDGNAHKNLYGRMMTIVEAVIENKDRQKAVKDLISKELGDFSRELYRSVAELANHGDSSNNIYTRN